MYRYRISGTDTSTVPVQMWTVPNPIKVVFNIFYSGEQNIWSPSGFVRLPTDTEIISLSF